MVVVVIVVVVIVVVLLLLYCCCIVVVVVVGCCCWLLLLLLVVVVVVVDIVDVVFASTCTIKSVVTGQAPVTLELRNTLGKNTNNPKVVDAYITADAIHASTRNI